MKARLLLSVFAGGLLTSAKLVLVAHLGGEVEAPPPPPKASGPVVVDAPPPPPPPTPVAPERPELDVGAPEAPSAPTPARARAALPDFAPAASGLDLGSALPGLSDGAGGVALDLAAPPEPDRAAVPQRSPDPAYPEGARRRGIEGFVVLRMRVDATGRVADAVVVRSEPEGVFERSAKQAALASRFLPARSRGKPVPSTLEQKLQFRLR
jgi:protein TonB